jgi:hypothetical protein
MSRRIAIAGLLALAALVTLPRFIAGWDAKGWFDGDPRRAEALGRSVSRELSSTRIASFTTGSARFDGEWRFGTAMMAAMGYGQVAARDADRRTSALAEMDRALASAIAADARKFDRDAWSNDALESLDGDQDHAAYLGYLGLALSVRRFVAPENPYAALDDRVTDALARRLERKPVLESYPGERYPVDNCAAIAAIALRDRALGLAPRAIVARSIENLRANWTDPKTGLLVQALETQAPRGSGTTLAAYFSSFADASFSRDLFDAARRELSGDVLGFGVMREYPRGASGGGDIDSGPLVFGWSISAMGFAMGAARIHRDHELFTELYRSFELLGAPSERGAELSFVSGGPLGNAIVFAMLTAEPAERWSRR